MDPATIIGIIIAFAAMFAMLIMEGASPFSILLPAPMIFVFGATIAVAVASGTMKDLGVCIGGIPKALLGKKPKVAERIDKLVELAGVARADGFLALESHAQGEEDPFFAAGLQSLADGVDGEALRQQLEDDIDTKAATDRVPAKFYTTMGAYAPTIGVIGTVVALTQALENLSEPEQLGSMIAAAFVATLWGLVSSNLMWLPIGARLGRLSELEQQEMNVTMEGLLAIQEGSQPMLLQERLSAMVPNSELVSKGGEKAKEPAPEGEPA
ncbi:motility protein A [Nesterenkonia populi]